MAANKAGVIIILSSPSGAGKTTLVKKIASKKNFKISISYTTRKPRLKEKNGINNLWKEEQYKDWREEVKKHPEKVGKLHITENSFTFKFSE